MRCKDLKNNYLTLISKRKEIEKKIISLNKVITEFSTDYNKLDYLEKLSIELNQSEILKNKLATEIEKLTSENKFLKNNV